MPRLTAAREQAVRARIVGAALRVFSARGYHAATMGDIVRESGMSVGAIYSHFAGKEELFLACCELGPATAVGELAVRVAAAPSTRERFALALSYYLDVLEPGASFDLTSMLVVQWSRVEESPGVRAPLLRRREQYVASAEMLLADAVRRGELPPWVDVSGLANAWQLFLDGMLLWRLEAGDRYRRADAERMASAYLAPLLASVSATEPAPLPFSEPRPWATGPFAAQSRG